MICKMKNASKDNSIIRKCICVFVSLFIIFLRYILGNIYYEVNDDYTMDYISQGKYGNGYDDHLIFINVILGKILKLLYHISEKINWFAILYLIIVIAAFSILMYVFWNYFDSVAAIPIVGLIELCVLHCFTFTVIAYMCIITGIFCFVYAITKTSSWSDYLISIVLIVVGVMVRDETFITSLLLALPLIVYVIFKIKKNKEKRKGAVIAIACCLIGIVVVTVYDNYCYTNPLWKEYKEYNAALKVIDYPLEAVKNNKQLLEENHLSQNDLACFENWIFADKEVYTKETLINLYENNALTNRYNFNVLDIMKQMLTLKRNYLFLAVGVFCLLFIKKGGIPYIFGTICITEGTIAALIFRNRLIPRVMLPIYLIGMCIIFFFTVVYIKKRKINYFSVILSIISLLGSVAIVGSDYKKGIEIAENRSKYSCVRDYIYNHQDTLYLTATLEMDRIQSAVPILEKSNDTNQNNLMPLGGWSTYSGKYYMQVEKYHLTNPDRLLLSLVEDDNVKYIGSTSDTSQNQLIINYIEEHTDKKVISSLVELFEKEEMAVYDLQLEE